MTADHPNPDETRWSNLVISYLRQAIPQRKPGEWDHAFISAYQMGVMALVALGEAEETKRGAVALTRPTLPDMLPRWDDTCCAILSLMSQLGDIRYRNMDGTLYEPPSKKNQFIVRTKKPLPIPDPNITAGHNCGPALAAHHVLELLEVLGLIHKGRWTSEAELVLWRKQPVAWGLTVPEDSRFDDALGVCLASLPESEADEIASLVNVSEAEIAESLMRHEEFKAEQRKKFGPKVRLGRAPDVNSTKRSLVFALRNQLDWMFFRGWRLPGGWLSLSERSAALEVFHDPLAIQMRRTVIQQLHPNSDVAKAT